MIDLTKPIRHRDGREAEYLGKLPDGRVAIGYPAATSRRWCAYSYDPCELEAYGFENIPPACPKLTGFCLALDGQDYIRQADTLEELRNGLTAQWAIDLSTLTEKNFVRVRGEKSQAIIEAFGAAP